MKIKSTLKNFSSPISNLSFQKGFTLIELLIVIGIMGILSTVVLAAINPIKKINQAKDANIKVQINQIAGAMRAAYTSSIIQSATGTPTWPADVKALVTSKELQAEPLLPGDKHYDVVALTMLAPGGGACTGDDCKQIAVYAPLNDPTAVEEGTSLHVWCWRSVSGKSAELKKSECESTTP